jgi:hypothetical protein
LAFEGMEKIEFDKQKSLNDLEKEKEAAFKEKIKFYM